MKPTHRIKGNIVVAPGGLFSFGSITNSGNNNCGNVTSTSTVVTTSNVASSANASSSSHVVYSHVTHVSSSFRPIQPQPNESDSESVSDIDSDFENQFGADVKAQVKAEAQVKVQVKTDVVITGNAAVQVHQTEMGPTKPASGTTPNLT